VEVRTVVPRERGVRAAGPGVIGRVVLAPCEGHSKDIAVDAERGFEVRDVQDNKNESVAVLHLASVLASNGLALPLQTRPR
jgi:hypothetical protein